MHRDGLLHLPSSRSTSERRDRTATAAAGTVSRRDTLGLLAGAVLLPQAPEASAASTPPLRHERHHLFGSPIDLIVRPPAGAAQETAAGAIAQVLAGLQHIHARWNAWKPGDVSRLNAALRAGHAHDAPAPLVALIRAAAQLERASDGLFNAGIGGAVGAWGFHDDVLRPGARPPATTIARWREARPSLARDLESDGQRVRSRNPRLQLDFGALAKGAAADWALDRLRSQGLADAVVNLGGNLATAGDAGGRPWSIGVRDPFGDGLLAQLHTTAREAVVTSGTYERYRVLDGERCAHVLDPAQAAPAGGRVGGRGQAWVGVTIVHRSATLADAAATALLVAGPQRWRGVAERLGVSQALLVGDDGRCVVTAALAPRLRWTHPGDQRAVHVV